MTIQTSRTIEHPYPGLRPFHDRESKIFFGRAGQVMGIIERLRQHHFAAVIGGSGSGKSSIVRAGVIPKLRAYGITDQGDFWVPITFTPGDAPISRLVTTLEDVLEPQSEQAQDERRQRITRMLEQPDGLEAFLSEYHPQLLVEPGLEELRPHANLLLVVDQFEEIFRNEGRKTGQCRSLVELLVGAFKRRSTNIYIIITLRTEDLHRCAVYLSLPEVLNQTVFLTRRLSEDELEQAIERPPLVIKRLRERQHGTKDRRSIVFDEQLLGELYDDLAAQRADNDHLPLLQHLLYRIWEHASKECSKHTSGTSEYELPHKLTIGDLKAVIGKDVAAGPSTDAKSKNDNSLLARCLKTQTDRVFARLGNKKYHQDVARVMFQLLAYRDNAGNYTRRWTDREKIRKLAARTTGIGEYSHQIQLEIVDEVITAFSEPHPYIREETDEECKIDVSHEALIRKWPRFEGWLESERKAINVYIQIDDQFREMERACQGKIAAAQCWVRFFVGYLPQRMLKKVGKYKILERGQPWVKSYEGQRGSVVPDGTANDFDKVAAYIRSRGKVSKLVRFGAAALVAVTLFTTIGWLISDIRSTEKDLKIAHAKLKTADERVGRELAEISREAFKREAEAFQPFAVGARMEQPRAAWAAPQNERYLVALWEGAVALRALEESHPGFNIAAMQAVNDGKDPQHDQSLRFTRAVRLAFGTVNEAVYSLLNLPGWDLGTVNGGNAPGDAGEPIALSNIAQTTDVADLACRKALDITTDLEDQLYHAYQPGRGGAPGKGLYFNPKAKLQFTFYSDPNGHCHRVRPQGEAPGSELRYVDPDLRYYVVKAEVPREKKPQSLYTFIALRWTPHACAHKHEDGQCEQSWKLESNGKIRLLFGNDTEEPSILHYDKAANRIVLSTAKKFLSLAAPPLLETQVDESPTISENDCYNRLGRLGYEKEDMYACTMEGSLIAVATGERGSEDKSAQVIHILSDNPTLATDEASINDDSEREREREREIVKFPIAKLSFKGEKIIGLSLGEKASAGHGELWLRFDSGTLLKTAWGGNALRAMACEVLKQLSEDRKQELPNSPLHSEFFTATSKSDGIIKRNKSFASICGGMDKS